MQANIQTEASSSVLKPLVIESSDVFMLAIIKQHFYSTKQQCYLDGDQGVGRLC